MKGGTPKGGSWGPPEAGGEEDAGSPVTRTRSSRTGVHRATERTPALIRPQVSRPGRGSGSMAQRRHKRGEDDARQEGGAAKRNREAQADTKQSSKGCKDKDEMVNYVPSGRRGRIVSMRGRGRRRGAAVQQEPSTRRAHKQWHEGDRQVRGAGRRATRRQGWGLEHDAMCAERCPHA